MAPAAPLVLLFLIVVLPTGVKSLAIGEWAQRLLGMGESEIIELFVITVPVTAALLSLSLLIFFLIPKRVTLIRSRDGRHGVEFWHARRHARQLDGILRGIESAEAWPDTAACEPASLHFTGTRLSTLEIVRFGATPVVGLFAIPFLVPPGSILVNWLRGLPPFAFGDRHCRRASARVVRGDYTGAVAELTPLVETHQLDAAALRLMVIAHALLGEFDAAAAWCTRLEEDSPGEGAVFTDAVRRILSWQTTPADTQ